MTFFLLSLILLLLLEDVMRRMMGRVFYFGLLVDERCYVLDPMKGKNDVHYIYIQCTDRTHAGIVGNLGSLFGGS